MSESEAFAWRCWSQFMKHCKAYKEMIAASEDRLEAEAEEMDDWSRRFWECLIKSDTRSLQHCRSMANLWRGDALTIAYNRRVHAETVARIRGI